MARSPWFAAGVAMAIAACSGNQEHGGNQDDGGAPQAARGSLALKVNQARVLKSRDSGKSAWTTTQVFLDITLANGADAPDLSLNPALFSVKTSQGISKTATQDRFATDTQVWYSTSFFTGKPCDPLVSITAGTAITCTLGANFDGDLGAVELTYRTPGAVAAANGVAAPDADRRTATAPIATNPCSPCGDLCTETAFDPFNCGACGREAPNKGACVDGKFSCSDAAAPDLCTEGEKSYCTNLQTDRDNCGTCGKRISVDEITCVGGQPACSAAAETLCHVNDLTYCADLQSDRSNCGACGREIDGAGATCVNGKVHCAAATPDVCTDKSNSNYTYCTNLQTGPQDCGTCGLRCTSSAPMCRNGHCGF